MSQSPLAGNYGNDQKLYDLQHLLAIVNNDKDFVKGLIEIFVLTIPPLIENMCQACENKDWTLVAKLAHKLKPTIETMRISSVLEEVKLIENNAKLQTEVQQLSSACTTVKMQIAEAVVMLQKDLAQGL